MQDNQRPVTSKSLLWTGRVISALPALMLLASGVMKLTRSEDVIKGFSDLGYNPDIALGIGLLELACTVLYIIPRTAVLGAILLTGYMGGAIATHVRLGEPFFAQVIIGVLIWLGLYLRDARLRELLPLRS
jgi:uncharacterized membrane protein YphA (DoxX/SURF4 family)